MAKQGFDPEEQLLDLIEKGEGFRPSKLRRKKASFLSFFNLSRFRLSFQVFSRQLKAKFTKLRTRVKNPRVLNRTLAGLAIALVVYSVADFTFRRLDVQQTSGNIIIDGEPYFLKKPETDVHQFLYYLEMVQRRNIFSPVTLKSAENLEAETNKMLSDLLNNLGLVGISWGKPPEAMVEDKGANKTYFLRAGDSINKFKVIDILRDRIVLDFDGKQVELK